MYTDINYLYLKNHDVFSGLNKDQLYDVLRYVKFKRKKKSDIVRMSEAESNKIYFLIKGNLKISETDEDGNEFIKEIVKEGGIFGNFSSLGRSTYEYAQALSSEVVYFTIQSEEFEILSATNPKLALNLSKAVGDKLKKSQQRYNHLAFKDVRSRLVHFFKSWALEEGVKDGNKILIRNYLTHQDIAGIISTCRQTVTAILNELKSNGDISYSRKQIVISDINMIGNAA